MRRNEIDRDEPFLQSNVAVLEKRAYEYRELFTASRALVLLPTFERVYLLRVPTVRAPGFDRAIGGTPTGVLKMLSARLVIGKLPHEIKEAVVLRVLGEHE